MNTTEEHYNKREVDGKLFHVFEFYSKKNLKSNDSSLKGISNNLIWHLQKPLRQGMGIFYTEAIQVLENQKPEFIGITESTSAFLLEKLTTLSINPEFTWVNEDFKKFP
jgi:hypothetical protein